MQSTVPPPKPPSGRTSQREGQRLATRARILDAATEIFAARGFDGTAMPAVAEACDVRVSLIVYHFESKDGLWRAVVDRVFRAVEAYVDERAETVAAADGIEHFRRAIRAQIEAAARTPAYHRILFQEAMQDTPRLRYILDTHHRAMTERIVATIERAQREGFVTKTLSPIHLKFITSGMFALPITLAPEYRLLAGEDALSDDFIERHINACLAILTAGAGA